MVSVDQIGYDLNLSFLKPAEDKPEVTVTGSLPATNGALPPNADGRTALNNKPPAQPDRKLKPTSRTALNDAVPPATTVNGELTAIKTNRAHDIKTINNDLSAVDKLNNKNRDVSVNGLATHNTGETSVNAHTAVRSYGLCLSKAYHINRALSIDANYVEIMCVFKYDSLYLYCVLPCGILRRSVGILLSIL